MKKHNHPISKKQKLAINVIIEKLKIEDKKNNFIRYENIDVCGSDFTNEIFISFKKIYMNNAGDPSFENKYIGIEYNGKIDYEPLKRDFKTIADRVFFFNNLYKIQ